MVSLTVTIKLACGVRLSDNLRAEKKPSENDARDLGKGRTLPPSHQAHPFLHILELLPSISGVY